MSFRELSHTEEMDAYEVYNGNQPARRQRTKYAEITQRLLDEKADGKEAMSVWKNLRSSYKKKKDKKLPSGSASEPEK
uniref:MADF domain-containing protein n=1 Tax=Ditylenchus dipsaci TaxID=166011 RepID=A0A915DLL3_9BILA